MKFKKKNIILSVVIIIASNITGCFIGFIFYLDVELITGFQFICTNTKISWEHIPIRKSIVAADFDDENM